MRILFLYMFPLWGNGSASYLRELCAELAKRGHEIAIVSPDKRKLPNVTHYIVNPPQMGVFIGHPELASAKKFGDMSGQELGHIFASYFKTTVDAVTDFNPEIIHVFHTAFLPPIARIIKLLFGLRFIITTHASDLDYLAKDRRFIGLIKDANRVCGHITANSDFTKKLYVEMFGESIKRKTKVIPGGVRLTNFTYDEKKIEEINKKYNLEGKKVVLFTGRLTKEKGVKYLVKAAQKIDGTVVIVGDGPYRYFLEEQIRINHIQNVILAGYHNSDTGLLHAFYERADVYVSPTMWEGFGLTLLEAMATHTPVVASNKGGIVSIIKNNVNGFLISARNPKEIATTVNKLLQDSELAKRIGDEGYKTILEKFTWEKVADQFEEIYKQFAFSTKEYVRLLHQESSLTSHILQVLSKFGK